MPRQMLRLADMCGITSMKRWKRGVQRTKEGFYSFIILFHHTIVGYSSTKPDINNLSGELFLEKQKTVAQRHEGERKHKLIEAVCTG